MDLRDRDWDGKSISFAFMVVGKFMSVVTVDTSSLNFSSQCKSQPERN